MVVRTLVIAALLSACASFEIKKESVGATNSVKPEPEPDNEELADRLLAGQDVAVTHAGDRIGVRLCLRAERTRCEVIFVARHHGVIHRIVIYDERVPGSFEQQTARAHGAVKDAITPHLGWHRIALSKRFPPPYGVRTLDGRAIYPRVVATKLELFDYQHPAPALPGTTVSWPFGAAISGSYDRFQSGRAKHLMVFEMTARTGEWNAFVAYLVDASDDYDLIHVVPPLGQVVAQPPPDNALAQ